VNLLGSVGQSQAQDSTGSSSGSGLPDGITRASTDRCAGRLASGIGSCPSKSFQTPMGKSAAGFADRTARLSLNSPRRASGRESLWLGYWAVYCESVRRYVVFLIAASLTIVDCSSSPMNPIVIMCSWGVRANAPAATLLNRTLRAQRSEILRYRTRTLAVAEWSQLTTWPGINSGKYSRSPGSHT